MVVRCRMTEVAVTEFKYLHLLNVHISAERTYILSAHCNLPAVPRVLSVPGSRCSGSLRVNNPKLLRRLDNAARFVAKLNGKQLAAKRLARPRFPRHGKGQAVRSRTQAEVQSGPQFKH